MNPDLKWAMFYPHAAEKVWTALTDPQALAAWLDPEGDVLEYRAIHVAEQRRVTYFWKTSDRDAVVSFDLIDTAGGVKLHVRMDECFAAALDSLETYLATALADPSGHRWAGVMERSRACLFKVPGNPATAPSRPT